MSEDVERTEEQPQAKWRPLDRTQRRVFGVLIEKAKTTPDSYPMSLNAIVTGSNQKSNRSPQMNLDTDDVEATLDELREMGAVAEIQGGGRVSKYRHFAYDWLGVDKTEIAVMGELLLRGEQTIGELRGRAARMQPIADLAELRPVLASLIEKNLVVSLTPEGRGQIVTHNLYEPDELARVKQRVADAGPVETGDSDSATPSRTVARQPPADNSRLEELQSDVQQLRQQVRELQDRLEKIEQMVQ